MSSNTNKDSRNFITLFFLSLFQIIQCDITFGREQNNNIEEVNFINNRNNIYANKLNENKVSKQYLVWDIKLRNDLKYKIENLIKSSKPLSNSNLSTNFIEEYNKLFINKEKRYEYGNQDETTAIDYHYNIMNKMINQYNKRVFNKDLKQFVIKEIVLKDLENNGSINEELRKSLINKMSKLYNKYSNTDNKITNSLLKDFGKQVTQFITLASNTYNNILRKHHSMQNIYIVKNDLSKCNELCLEQINKMKNIIKKIEKTNKSFVTKFQKIYGSYVNVQNNIDNRNSNSDDIVQYFFHENSINSNNNNNNNKLINNNDNNNNNKLINNNDNNDNNKLINNNNIDNEFSNNNVILSINNTSNESHDIDNNHNNTINNIYQYLSHENNNNNNSNNNNNKLINNNNNSYNKKINNINNNLSQSNNDNYSTINSKNINKINNNSVILNTNNTSKNSDKLHNDNQNINKYDKSTINDQYIAENTLFDSQSIIMTNKDNFSDINQDEISSDYSNSNDYVSVIDNIDELNSKISFNSVFTEIPS